MFLRGGKVLVVLALVLTTGLHWAALQTVAWTTMLANNLRCGSFSQAVDNTFDGRHPCPLCKAIAAAKKSQNNSATANPVLKMEFPLAAAKILLIPPAQFVLIPINDSFAGALPVKPLLPPPRCFFV